MSREISRTDQGRREQGARINNRHVPSKDREGDGAVTSDVPASIDLPLLLSALAVGATQQIVATIRNAAGAVLSMQPDGWASADPSTVSVDGVGRITGRAAGGPVLITASIGSVSSSTPVSVAAGVDLVAASVDVSPTAVSISSGTRQLTATIKNAGGTPLALSPTSWTSSAPGVATVDSAGLVTFVGAGTTNVVAHYNAIPSNACVVTGVLSGAVGANFLKHDFEDGTLGPFYSPYAAGGAVIDVISDPTSRASGKVARMHYAQNPAAGNFDSNLAIAPKNPGGIFTRGLGQEVWFQGDVYIDSPGLVACQRKLIYWGWSNDSWGFQHGFNLVISSFNSVAEPIPPNTPLQITVHSTVIQADGTAIGAFGPDINAPGHAWYGPVILTTQAWHRVKVQMKLNSAFNVADGILRMWLDGVLFFECLDMRWTSPDWTDDPSTYQWVDWRVGEQVNATAQIDEYRYWDNVSFADAESAL